jgi:hypothetical protein
VFPKELVDRIIARYSTPYHSNPTVSSVLLIL